MALPWKRPGWRGVLLGGACGLLAWCLAQWSLVKTVENWMQDGAFHFRDKRNTNANIVIVGLDEEYLNQLNKPIAFISPELAEVISYLGSRKAAAIGVDMMLPESLQDLPELKPGGIGDALKFTLAAAQAENVVVAKWRLKNETEQTIWSQSIQEWQLGAISEGFINLTEDPDFFLRRQQLIFKEGAGAVQQFALSVLSVAQGKDTMWDEYGLSIGNERIELDSEGRVYINYVGPPGTIKHKSFRNVLEAARNIQTLDFDPRGAIMIIGITARTQQDYHATPFSNNYWRILPTDGTDLMSGCEIHANIIATILDRAYIHIPPWWVNLGLVVIVGMLMGRVLAFLSLTGGLVVAIGHHFGWKLLVLALFAFFDLRLEMISMLGMGVILYAFTFGMRWRRLRTMLGVVKSEAIARIMEEDPGAFDPRGEARYVTILFADIRGFGKYCLDHGPREIMALLNAYYTAIVPIIESNGGVLNQYMGDGIMVLFNAPSPCPNHEVQAARTAKAMVERVHGLKELWMDHDFPAFRIGVGINTGAVVAGTVGSPRRLDYSATGQAVNTAARIEAATKEFGVEILISHETFKNIPPKERERLGCRADTFEIKQKEAVELVHEIVVQQNT